jgi:hypothetical protein
MVRVDSDLYIKIDLSLGGAITLPKGGKLG